MDGRYALPSRTGVDTSVVGHPHDAVTAYTARMGDKAKPLRLTPGGFAVCGPRRTRAAGNGAQQSVTSLGQEARFGLEPFADDAGAYLAI